MLWIYGYYDRWGNIDVHFFWGHIDGFELIPHLDMVNFKERSKYV